MAVDLHTAQIQGFFDGPVDHLWALPLLSDYVAKHYGTEQLAVVSPDAGRIRVAEMWSERLSGAPLAFIHKTRDINRPNEAVANRVVGEVAGCTCVLVDDMIDTGSTSRRPLTRSTPPEPRGGDRGNPCRDVGTGGGPAQELPGPRGRRHEHAAGSTGSALRQAHHPVDRPAHRPGDQEVFQDGSVTSLFDGNA